MNNADSNKRDEKVDDDTQSTSGEVFERFFDLKSVLEPVTIPDIPPVKARASQFRHNPLHDHESVLWMATWAFVHRIPKSGSPPEPGAPSLWDMEPLREFADMIFPVYEVKHRQNFIMFPELSKRLARLLDPRLKFLGPHLAQYIGVIRDAFYDAEEPIFHHEGDLNASAFDMKFAVQCARHIKQLILATPVGMEMMDFPIEPNEEAATELSLPSHSIAANREL